MHPLMKKMSAGKVVVGMTAAELLRPPLVKIYANAGADFIYIENEHSLLNPATYADFLLCAHDNGMPVVAKTPYLDRGAIVKLLDSGTGCLQLPMTESPEHVLTLHNWLKYPPLGERAICCGYASTGYKPVDLATYVKQQNEDTMLIAHIETKKGVDAIDDILGTGVVDLAFIGQDDLSISVGAPGDHHDPKHVAAIKRVAEAARKHNVFFGLFAPGTESAKRWIEEGALFFEAADELMLIDQGARTVVEQFKALGK
jgi:2-keto-3-deoxy-L-rhamnonate aldolase RhmA